MEMSGTTLINSLFFPYPQCALRPCLPKLENYYFYHYGSTEDSKSIRRSREAAEKAAESVLQLRN